MASGGDPPQLPRGLIGRTGAPSGKGARLPSIKGPRDLTLGGVQKKVFVPNIPARRKQSEGSTSESASTSSKPKANENKSNDSHSGHRGRGRGSGDRGRGRGRGRVSANVIQTHSLFEQGPQEKTNRPSGGGDYAYSGGGRGGSSGASPKKSFKREKTDEETKEVLDHLLRDDFISGNDLEDEDVTLMPVKLPIELKTEIKSEDYTKVKVKAEPMDTDDLDAGKVRDEKFVKDDLLKGRPDEKQITCSELFTNLAKSDEGQFLYFQLPDTLPGLPMSTDEDFKKRKATETSADSQEKDISKKMNECNLDNFSEGLIGKLVVRKSGRVQLKLGETYLDVNMGTPCGFLQDVASVRVNGEQGEISVLGHVDHRLVCTPDFQKLLEDT